MDPEPPERAVIRARSSWSEADRLVALDRYAILDTPREAEFDDIVRLASDVFEAPISVVNLIAGNRQWFKAEVGIGADELPLDVSICAHAILQPGVFVVPDTTVDPRFDRNPLVIGAPGLRFYAGALVETPEGLPLGTVCVLDTKARDGITPRQKLTLEILARQVMTQLELRQAIRDRDQRAERLELEIAGRVAADRALFESEERLRLAVDNAEIGFWDVDVVNDILVWPARTKAMFGISADVPVTMRDFYDGLHPADRAATAAAFAGAADPARRALYDVEYRTIGKEDGIARWVAAKGRGVFDPQGRCLRVTGTAIDITERQRIAADLLASEARLRVFDTDMERQVADRASERARLWQVSPDLLSVIDIDSASFDRVNPAWSAALGWSVEEMDGQPCERFVHPDDVGADAFAQVRAGRPAFRFENRYRTKSGDWRWLSWVAVPEGGKLYATTRDVTEDKVRAEALAAAEAALRQSQKMDAVGQLTGGIAHDFNNMLAVVIGSLDLLDRRLGAADARAKRYVDAAADGARRAAALTQRLLAFSRQQPLKPEPIDTNKLVAGMSDLLHHSLGGEVRMETVLAAGLWRTSADPNQLENVVLNLAINARDAMPGGGRLTIETQNAHLDARYVAAHIGVPAGQYVMIAVSDTGSGMPEEVIAKAFDPFFTTKGVGKGTGLGLSQVYGFVKQSGGHVKIYSEPGEGTAIKVYLPRLIGGGPALETAVVPRDMPLGDGREVVLVVEDEPAVRRFTVDALTELGYRVLEADGAAAALRLLDAHPEIALMFTDVVMPEVNGAKLAEQARRRRADLRILFTTGYTRNAVVHNGVLDPGVELIGKPFTIEELAARIREVLDAPVGESGRAL